MLNTYSSYHRWLLIPILHQENVFLLLYRVFQKEIPENLKILLQKQCQEFVCFIYLEANF